MKILVINGSPRGKYSVTLQSSEYLKIKFPWHEFGFLNVGRKIKALEKDFTSAAEMIGQAELIIFSYPVYTFITPYQLHRFIELMKEEKVDLQNKFVTQITTSKHFYDVTAHKFIEENMMEMGARFIKGLSADMDDLTTAKGQKELIAFFRYTLWCCENNRYELPMKNTAAKKPVKVSVAEENEKTVPGEVVVVTDCGEKDKQLRSMIDRFCAVLPVKSKVVNIRDFNMKGGCLGCFNCSSSGKCIYNDGFDGILRNEIQSSSAIVYAFKIKDHSMGSLFKMYDDRQFCNGHRTVTMGMPVAYLVSGEYSKENNLRMIIEGRSEVGGNFLAGVATDELDPDGEIDKMAKTLVYALENEYAQPANFYGVGGMKIFRDLIYLMQGMMRADHKFYKAHGQYDFPQKKKGTLAAMYLVGAMMSSDKLKKKVNEKMGANMMDEGMIMPYKKVLEDAKKEKGQK